MIVAQRYNLTQTPEVKSYPEAQSYILTLLDRPSVLAQEWRSRLERKMNHSSARTVNLSLYPTKRGGIIN